MSSEQIKAVVSMGAVLVVNLANMLGFTLEIDGVYQVILILLAFLTIIYGCYKNHNFTEAASDAQKYLACLKRGDEDYTNNDVAEYVGEEDEIIEN